MSFSGFCHRHAVSCFTHACMWISELNYGSFRFLHQSWRLQGASLSHLSTLLFKWAITLKGVDANFPLQISYDFHDRFLWALSTTLPARRSGSIAELSFVPPFSLDLYCWCCSSATQGIRDLTLWGLVKLLSCWWGGSSVCACAFACLCATFRSGNKHTAETSKRCLNEVPVQRWWVVFDGHVICLFSPNGLFCWLRKRESRRKAGGGPTASHLLPSRPHQWAI